MPRISRQSNTKTKKLKLDNMHMNKFNADLKKKLASVSKIVDGVAV